MAPTHFPVQLTVRAFGVSLELALPSSTQVAPVIERLPPGWVASDSDAPQRRYRISPSHDGQPSSSLSVNGHERRHFDTVEALLDDLEGDMQLYVAEFATPHLFIHAGVVGWNGSAILLPGRSFAGKSTLVTSLVQAGATYFSDEYAVIDDRGMVWPYRRRVSLREGPHGPARRLDLAPDTAPCEPVPISLVALLRYVPGGCWRVERRTPAEALMRLADQTVAIRRRPQEALAYLGRVVEDASVIEGTRGEVEDAADRLLEMATTGSGEAWRSPSTTTVLSRAAIAGDDRIG